jgi:hypothetical protein
MSLHWLTWSNPVAIWWGFLIAVSAANIALWLMLHSWSRRSVVDWRRAAFAIEPLVLLSAAYVFGCAFRSLLPRADVQRICLFDTFLSSVVVGRSVATIAEICFAVQWAIVLRELARMTHSDTGKNISRVIVPLIVVAECFSWYAVITTDFLGNAIENSIWTVTFALIAIALLRLVPSFRGPVQWAIAAAAAGIAAYVVFMASVDVPMYYARWQIQLADGREFLGAFSGLYDAATRWVVTHDLARWKNEIAWMSLYFSVAVWSSLALAGFVLVREHLPRYRARRPFKFSNRPAAAIPVRASQR